MITMSGGLASANLYRFSSKEFMYNSGLYYYGYRFDDPNLQRWLNRDPLGEVGVEVMLAKGDGASLEGDWPNLYTFALNNPVGFTDSLGLEVYKNCVEDTKYGGFLNKKSTPTGRRIWVPGRGDYDEMRVYQRKCHFRCYHKDTVNCPKLECKDKSCEKDHGVAIQITVNAVGSGAAAKCSEIASEVMNGSITGGSISRNHKPIIKAAF